MSISPETVVVGVGPRISRAKFVALLAGSPLSVDEARSGWDGVVAQRVDPLFALAIFRVESKFGTAGICARYQTHSPGNTLSSRSGVGELVETPQGEYVRYPTWTDGWHDLAFRLADPGYVYFREGRDTIGEIIPRFAPKGAGGNDPAAYVKTVVRLMNDWFEAGDHGMMRDANAIWMPSSNFTPGRPGPVTGITDHITQGTDSLAWLRGAAGGSSNRGSSATYLVARDGTKYQLVDELDTPWTDGNLAYNERHVTIEAEGFSGQPLTPAQIVALAELHRDISARHGFPLDREHVIGHYQVPDPNHPGQFGGVDHHVTCPGDAFPWDQVLGLAPVDHGAVVPPLEELKHPTGAIMVRGFKDWWISENPEQRNLRYFGYALTNEFVAQLPGQPQVYTYQVGQRGTVTWRGGNRRPWDIYLVFADEDRAARDYAQAHGLFV